MEWAREEARAGTPTGSVYAAKEQRAGRGRSGRSWASPGGGLYASVLLRERDRTIAPLLPLAGALAVHQALCALAPGLRFRVKWPNDVLAGRDEADGKIAGVLTDASATGAEITWVVLGFGVNLATPAEDLPRDVEPPAVSLHTLGATPPALDEALTRILNALATLLEDHRGRPAALVSKTEEVLALLGRKVHAEGRGDREDVQGVLKGIHPSGDALLSTTTGVVRVAAWDVERIREV